MVFLLNGKGWIRRMYVYLCTNIQWMTGEIFLLLQNNDRLYITYTYDIMYRGFIYSVHIGYKKDT